MTRSTLFRKPSRHSWNCPRRGLWSAANRIHDASCRLSFGTSRATCAVVRSVGCLTKSSATGSRSPTTCGVDELLARAEEEFRLMGCVSKLSDVQQRVVRLRMLEELSGDDVARELGLRPDHVATLLYRAKKEL